MKTFFFSLFALLTTFSAFASADIEGLWMAMDDETNKPGCIVSIYEYKGKYFGRIIAIYDGKNDNEFFGTIYAPKKRAPGIAGHPFYSGLDLIWDLVRHGSKYTGNIVDPRKGDVYKAEVWREGKNLIVRGKLWIFGRNQTWYSVDEKKLPKGFKIPDPSKFIPEIPRAK